MSHRSEVFHPTMRLENASRTAASHSTPSPTGMRVASATHNRSGAVAVNCRLTRSGAGVARGSCFVELTRHLLRRNAPCRPWVRMSRSMRLRPTWMPRRASVAWTRGDPYVPPDSSCTSTISLTRPWSTTVRSHGCAARLTHP